MTAAFLPTGPNPLILWLRAMGVDTSMSRRVVIDIDIESAVIIYVEQYANKAMMDALPDPKTLNPKIVILDVAPNGERTALADEYRRLGQEEA